MENHMYASAWKSSCSQAQYTEAAPAPSTHLPTPFAPAASSKAASWDLYDHSSLFECTRCTQGNYTSYGEGALGKGGLNIIDGEVLQDLQYQMDEEDDTCIGMEMKMMKKRKLTNEQARELEASFEADKKLEAEKKQRLATQLGLQPRQVAVWFQNRRARSKTKQLEIDFVALKTEYDRVLAQRRSLQAEILRLTAELQAKNSRTKISSCSQDSTSSTNSNNGDVLSESTTMHIENESPTMEKGGVNYNTSEDIGKTKNDISRVQDFSKYSNISNYDWESYDNELWVFD